MSDNHMKRGITVTGKMQIQTIMRQHYIFITRAKMRKRKEKKGKEKSKKNWKYQYRQRHRATETHTFSAGMQNDIVILENSLSVS